MNACVPWLATEARTIYTIQQLLQRYVAWSISTSGVEQNFALRKLLISPHRAKLNPNTEQNLMTIATHDTKSEVDEVHNKALSIWRELYKPPPQIPCQGDQNSAWISEAEHEGFIQRHDSKTPRSGWPVRKIDCSDAPQRCRSSS